MVLLTPPRIKILIVIGTIFILVYLYNRFRKIQISNPVLIRQPIDTTIPLIIPRESIPEPKDGLSYTLMFWMYINDWDYRRGEWKHVLHKASDEIGTYPQPGIWLAPESNDLVIRYHTDGIIGNYKLHKGKVPKSLANFKEVKRTSDSTRVVFCNDDNDACYKIYNISNSNIEPKTIKELKEEDKLKDKNKLEADLREETASLVYEQVNKDKANTSEMASGESGLEGSSNTLTKDISESTDKVHVNKSLSYGGFTFTVKNKSIDTTNAGMTNVSGIKYIGNNQIKISDNYLPRHALLKTSGIAEEELVDAPPDFYVDGQENVTPCTMIKENNASLSPEADDSILEDNDHTAIIKNVPIKRWFHVALVVNEYSNDIYIDGRIRLSKSFPNYIKQNTGNMFVSHRGGFDGMITQLTMKHKPSTHEDILFTAKLGPDPLMLPDLTDYAASYVPKVSFESDEAAFQKGSKVISRKGGKGLWYPGRISKINTNGTLNIVYDDGESEKYVKRNYVKLS